MMMTDNGPMTAEQAAKANVLNFRLNVLHHPVMAQFGFLGPWEAAEKRGRQLSLR